MYIGRDLKTALSNVPDRLFVKQCHSKQKNLNSDQTAVVGGKTIITSAVGLLYASGNQSPCLTRRSTGERGKRFEPNPLIADVKIAACILQTVHWWETLSTLWTVATLCTVAPTTCYERASNKKKETKKSR
jgi:hypothetical protein